MLSHRPGMTGARNDRVPLAESFIAISLPSMFVRLTRPVRAKVGWFAALLYLFCMLAPGIALAFGDAASCLTAEVQPTATTPMAAAHVHAAAAALSSPHRLIRHNDAGSRATSARACP